MWASDGDGYVDYYQDILKPEAVDSIETDYKADKGSMAYLTRSIISFPPQRL
jgi:hypothetical protein